MTPATRRPIAPWWFPLAVLGAWALACHLFGAHQAETLGPQQAFIGFIIAIAQAIWTGVQVAGRVTLAILTASVSALWVFARTVYNGVLGVGRVVASGFRKAWAFSRVLYDDVLKPAWAKLHTLYTKVRALYDSYVKPVLTFLDDVRKRLRAFYDQWIRPVVDTIGIARKMLRVLATLHLDFAAALEQKLANLEDRIDAPFRYVLGKLNETINLVNRIVTADGLLQRLALIRSVERDIRYVSRAFMNWRTATVTDDDYKRLRERRGDRAPADVRRDFIASATGGDGPYQAVVSEAAQQWALYASR